MHANDYLNGTDHLIREMELSDLPAVFLIEELCHDFDAWPEKLFEDCLVAGFPGFIVEHQSVLCGFVVCSIGADQMQILNIKIDARFRMQGFASQLLSSCIELAKNRVCEKILLEVRVSNFAAQHLYENFGFTQDGVRKGYYTAALGTREDALLYSLQLK